MSKAAQQQQQAQGANADQNNDSTVEDAEFKEVKTTYQKIIKQYN